MVHRAILPGTKPSPAFMTTYSGRCQLYMPTHNRTSVDDNLHDHFQEAKSPGGEVASKQFMACGNSDGTVGASKNSLKVKLSVTTDKHSIGIFIDLAVYSSLASPAPRDDPSIFHRPVNNHGFRTSVFAMSRGDRTCMTQLGNCVNCLCLATYLGRRAGWRTRLGQGEENTCTEQLSLYILSTAPDCMVK